MGQFNERDVCRTFAAITKNPGELREVFVFADGKRWRGFFDNPDKLIQALSKFKKIDKAWVTPNALNRKPNDGHVLDKWRPRNRLGSAKGKHGATAIDICRYQWLFLDIDRDDTNGSASKAEKRVLRRKATQIRRFLRERGWPDPVFSDSGNGYHLLYSVDLPTSDRSLLKRVIADLNENVPDDGKIDSAVTDPARFCKLYGTMMRKGEDTEDRPHRLSRLIDVPTGIDTVTREQLEALAGPVEDIAQPTPTRVEPKGTTILDRFAAMNDFSFMWDEGWHDEVDGFDEPLWEWLREADDGIELLRPNKTDRDVPSAVIRFNTHDGIHRLYVYSTNEEEIWPFRSQDDHCDDEPPNSYNAGQAFAYLVGRDLGLDPSEPDEASGAFTEAARRLSRVVDAIDVAAEFDDGDAEWLPSECNSVAILDKLRRDVAEKRQKPIFQTGFDLELTPGQMIVVGGEPGAGKSTLLLQALFGALEREPSIQAVISSVELSPEVIFEKQISRMSKKSATDIRYRNIEMTSDLNATFERLRTLAARVHFISPPFTLEAIRKAGKKHDAQIFLVDYLQRHKPRRGAAGEMQGQVADVMDGLRGLCNDGAAILIASALSRTASKSDPHMSAFRESSEIEYGVDDAYFMQVADGGSRKLVHLKSRFSKLSHLELDFDGDTATFRQVDIGSMFDG